MPRLLFGNQSQDRRRTGSSSLWWVSLILIVISAALITLYVRVDGGGAFAVVRSGVQTVTKPLEQVCSVLSTPFERIAGMGQDEQLEQLKQENEQLKTLVAQLEEYRQQDQRLTSLVMMQDMYGLESVSAQVIDTTSGWDRTATIDKGSNDGIRVGMGVVSSCGLYGQVESVTPTASVVRLVDDAGSSTSAMLQSSHARGIVNGAYDGTLTLEYVPIDTTVGEGDIVITSGQGGAYPRGIVMGTVSTISTDSSRLYYSITVEPIYSIQDCQEVMVLTGDESSTQNLLDEDMIEQITNAAAAANAESTDADAAASSDDAASTGTAMVGPVLASQQDAAWSAVATTDGQDDANAGADAAGQGASDAARDADADADAQDDAQDDDASDGGAADADADADEDGGDADD